MVVLCLQLIGLHYYKNELYKPSDGRNTLDKSRKILYNSLIKHFGGNMKSFAFRMAALLLAIITLIPAFAACTPSAQSEVTTEAPVNTEAPATDPETTPETEPAPKSYLTINAENASSVTIVRSDALPTKLSTALSLFTSFRKEINKRFGVEFDINTDIVMPDQSMDDEIEILVGDTVRDASIELDAKLAALGSNGFGIIVRGNKIAVSGTSLYLTYMGLDYLLDNLMSTDDSGKLQIKLEDGFEYIEKTDYDYPDPEEVIKSGKEYAFYSIEKLASVPTNGGYSVLQGGGSDGKYAYYAMINKATTPETAMIYKFDMATWELVAKSKSMPSAHTNDITYDSKNHRLVISYCSATDGYKGIVTVNPDTLEFIEYIVAPTVNRGVTYLPETNQYLFAQSYTFHLTDENFNTISSFTCGYPTLTTQGFYCDGKYIYDPRWKSGSRYQTITINTLDGQFIGAIPFYNVDGEPENIFRDGNSFVMGCNNSDSVFRIALLYKNWWD